MQQAACTSPSRNYWSPYTKSYCGQPSSKENGVKIENKIDIYWKSNGLVVSWWSPGNYWSPYTKR